MMTFMEQPIVITVNNYKQPSQSQQRKFINNNNNTLDSWQKVEDKSGVTYYWNINGNSPLASPAVRSTRRPIQNGKENRGGSVSKNHYHQSSVTPRSVDPTGQLIWSVPQSPSEKRSTVPAVTTYRKPRTPRFLRSLICCVTGDERTLRTSKKKNGNHHGYSSPDHPIPQPGPYAPKPLEKLLLPPIRPCDINKKCLIIDLDETLVHSSFKPVKNPDFVIPVEIDGVIHQVYVLKRPFVDEFLQRIGDKFECILFTASLAKYADPVANLLDKRNFFRSRLFRDACVFHRGNYVKDLNRLGRDLKRVIIVDNSPASYAFHPDNAVAVQSWFEDDKDTELMEIVPLLERLAAVENVYSVLRNSNDPSPNPRSDGIQLLNGRA